MSRTAIIVQARDASTRFPAKVMKDLGGRTVLEHVLTRCAATPGVDVVCCATTTHSCDDAIAAEAARLGHAVFRGSEDDVLGRYLGAARLVGATTVMRVTSDCPFIDPDVCGQVLALLADSGAGFATNNMPPGWTHGLDCEAFSAAVLERAAAAAQTAYEREHVCIWMRESGQVSVVNLDGPGGDALDFRLTLDYPADLEMFRALLTCLPPWPTLARREQVLEALRAHPEIAALNAIHHHHP